MAFKGKQGEHALKKFMRDLKEDNLGNAVLLCGRERYLSSFAEDAIIKRYINPSFEMIDCVRFTEENGDFAGIRNACETISMLSKKHIVIASDFPLFSSGRMKGFSEDDKKALAEYVKEIPDGNMLIFVCGEVDSKKDFYKKIAKSLKVYDFDTLGQADLKSFVAKQIKAGGKHCRDSVIADIINYSGYLNKETDYTLYNLVNDIKKICAYAEDDEILSSDAAAVMSGGFETYIFSFIESITSGRKNDAFHMLCNILKSGESIGRILASVINQYEFILDVRELRDAGAARSEIAGILGANEYRVKLTFNIAEKYTAERLKKILLIAYEKDASSKKGIMSAEIAMELFIASV